jgi:branched-chain amino acid transport system ATP-binding protein
MSSRPISARDEMTPLLDIAELRCGYKQMEVLHGISLEVMPGEIVALVGANGAGKSTLINTIAGLVPVRSGCISFDGVAIGTQPTREIVRRGLGIVPERRQLFGTMTVEENLLIGAHARSDRPAPKQLRVEMEEIFELFPRLRERRRQLAQSMSGGEQQMTAIARALMGKPRLLLLDEPSLGLAPLLVDQIMEQIVRLRAGGCTMLLAEQNARLALSVSDRAYVVETGRIALSGSAADLLGNERIQEAYLGGANDAENSMEARIRAKAQSEFAQRQQPSP